MLLPRDSRVIEPWRNGRGQTATVESDAHWRMSIARVQDASPFSSFPGAGRLLMPVSSPGLVLSINGERRALSAGEAAAFRGEDTVHADALTEPVEVINLISQRDRCAGELTAISRPGAGAGPEPEPEPGPEPAPVRLEAGTGVLVAIVTAGRWTVVGGLGLGPGPGLGSGLGLGLRRLDAVRLDPSEAVILSGHGAVALARIWSQVPT